MKSRRTAMPIAPPRRGCAAGMAGGFSLTELMIVVAIITILAAIALPNYTQQMERSRRTEALDSLLRIAAEEEKFFLQNNAYAGSMSDLGLNYNTTESGDYALVVVADANAGFIATAQAVADGRQADDDECLFFYLDGTGLKKAGPTSADADNADICWR